ncbi:MAG: hypothetical protein KDC84_04050 [Crocinitomicaceae bacterium]|nr:hypothetical protein [Crocinitomicaceae bacterium]
MAGKSGKKKKWKKILLYSLLSLLGLLVTAAILLFLFLEDIVEARIKDLLDKRFGGYYSLQWKSIEKDIGWSEMTFIVHEAKFTSDTTNVEGVENYPIIFFETKELRVKNLSTWDVLWGRKIDLDLIELVEPDFSLFAKGKKKEEKKEKKKKQLSKIELGRFSLVDGRLSIIDYKTQHRILYHDIVNVEVDQIKLDLNKMDNFIDGFKYEDFSVESIGSEFTPLKGFYEFGIDTLSWQGKEGQIQFRNIDIRTNESLKEISKTKLNHAEVVKAFVEKIDMQGVDASELIYNDRLEIDRVAIDGARMAIFKNKLTYMEPTFQKKVLNAIFRSVKYPIKIDTIGVQNLGLVFELMATSEKDPAYITLDSITGHFANINTSPQSQDTLNISIDAILLEKGELHLDLDIAIHDSVKNYQKFRGYLQSMPFSALNQTIQNFVNIKIVKGWIDRLDFSGYTNDRKSWGTIAFRYHDLEMDIYSFKDKLEKKKNGFLTGVAKMAIHKTNPLPNGDMRTAPFEYVKERWEGSVMLWLGGTLMGVFKTTLKDFVLDILNDQEEKKIKKAQKELKKKQKQEERQKQNEANK